MTVSQNASIMPRRLPLCWIFATALLVACGSEPVRQHPGLQVKKPSQVRKQAPTSVKSHDLKNDQASSHLLRADTLIQSGNSQAAQAELDLLNQAKLSVEQRSKFNLLAAQIDLNMGDAEHALQKLQWVRPAFLSKTDKVNYYQSLAFAQTLTGNVLRSVSSRIELEHLLDKPEQQQANMAAIIDMLSVLPEDVLNVQTGIAGELRGWIVLAKILNRRDQTGADMAGQIQQWRLDYPGHPANAEFLQTYLSAPKAAAAAEANAPVAQPQIQPQNAGDFIAVLLPASGAYAQAGQAVKEGLQVAYRLAASTAPQLALKFYDSGQENIVDLYNQAVAEGAKQVIGPLVKEQIEALALNAELSAPVLALNHVENLKQTKLYQFGLSPLDEADALAIKARADGRQSALILVPNTAQGQRIGHYLTSAWRNQGGTVAGIQSYDPKAHDISDNLKQLMASSTYPSGPQPARALLLGANGEAARELAPQLKYQQGSDIAVYAMPTIYSGRPNPQQDAELGSFSFCDTPWLFADYYGGPLSQSALQHSWRGLSESLVRLIALGIDAYNLLGHLDQLALTPYAGATGRLSLNAENRIVRKLVCARFTGGVPVATGFAE